MLKPSFQVPHPYDAVVVATLRVYSMFSIETGSVVHRPAGADENIRWTRFSYSRYLW
jgi:hypothetical protein